MRFHPGIIAGSEVEEEGPLPAFAYEQETEAIAAAFAVAPVTARKRTINRAIKRLKASGIFDKATAIYFCAAADEDASLKNWKTPGTYDLIKNGSPTFTANQGWQATNTGQYLDTQLPASSLQQNDLGHYIWCNTFQITPNNEYGSLGAGSVGISLIANTGSGQVQARAAGSTVIPVLTGGTDASGLSGVSRANANEITGTRNGVRKETVSQSSVALPNHNITLLAINNNGTISSNFSPRGAAFYYFGRALTEEQELELTGIVGEYTVNVIYGEPYIEEVGIGTSHISADCIFYGFTMQSVFGALQAARAGKSVAIIGGWRDRFNFGGLSSGGLGFTDFDNHDSLGGLPRYLINRMNALDGSSDFAFDPRNCTKALLELLDPTHNGGYDIPLYQTNGVVSVQKSGTRITSFTTTDGRTVSGLQFHDGSYEGDLMRLAGCSYTVGREAAGTNFESLNGVDSTLMEFDGVDPWNIPGDTTSGLIPTVEGIRSTFSPELDNLPEVGASDEATQAYNFRLSMITNEARRVPTPEPEDYDVAQYEFLLRFLEANPSIDSFGELFKVDLVSGASRYDINNLANPPAPSSDIPGSAYSWGYPLGSYEEREQIWKAHWNYLMGYLHTIKHGTDERIPDALKTSAQTFGFISDHYFSPHENDSVHHMPQMYVRETIRMVSDEIMTGTDFNHTDGSQPRISTKTVAAASYMLDSHATRRIAYEKTAGNWIMAHEGGFGQQGGGDDDTTPIPLEIVVPKATECTNLSVSFCVSATHVAFGAIRMEFTAAQIGQTMGQAMAEAIDGETSIQSVDYDAVRTVLLANSFALVDEPAPVLPQTM